MFGYAVQLDKWCLNKVLVSRFDLSQQQVQPKVRPHMHEMIKSNSKTHFSNSVECVAGFLFQLGHLDLGASNRIKVLFPWPDHLTYVAKIQNSIQRILCLKFNFFNIEVCLTSLIKLLSQFKTTVKFSSCPSENFFLLQCGCENLACPFCNLVESIRNRNKVFSNRKHSIIYQVSLYIPTFDTGAQYSVIDNEVFFLYYLSVYISTADAKKYCLKPFLYISTQ